MLLKKIAPVFLVFITSTVFADTDGERVALAQIIHELDALMPLGTENK